jgi:hypothetical protein
LKAPPGPPTRQRRYLEGVALLLLTISAILFQSSATSSWIETTAADGARYQVSPIGVKQYHDHDAQPASECRWWPRLGNEQLCAANDVGGPSQMKWLRRAYPLTVAALWMSVLALFLNALRVPRQAPAVHVIAALAPSVLGAVALWSMWFGATRALAVLEGLTPQPVLSGFGPVVTATVFATTAAVLLLVARR